MKRTIIILLAAMMILAGCSSDKTIETKEEKPKTKVEKKKYNEDPELQAKRKEYYTEELEEKMTDAMMTLKNAYKYDSEDPDYYDITSTFADELASASMAVIVLTPPKSLEKEHKKITDHLLKANKELHGALSLFSEGNLDGVTVMALNKTKTCVKEVGKAYDLAAEITE